MSSDFLIWRYLSVPGAAVLHDLRGFDENNRFDHGRTLKDEFPAQTAFHMDPDFPRDLTLPDNVCNAEQVLLVSQRLQQALIDARLTHVEYLPMTVVDHKGRVASSSHVIVHPLELVDCIDMQQSVYQPHRLVKGKIDKVTKLVLDEQRVPPDRQLFKLKGYPTPVIVRGAFARTLTQAGFSGLDWLDVVDFPD